MNPRTCSILLQGVQPEGQRAVDMDRRVGTTARLVEAPPMHVVPGRAAARQIFAPLGVTPLIRSRVATEPAFTRCVLAARQMRAAVSQGQVTAADARAQGDSATSRPASATRAANRIPAAAR